MKQGAPRGALFGLFVAGAAGEVIKECKKASIQRSIEAFSIKAGRWEKTAGCGRQLREQ